MTVQILQGDCIETLKTLEAGTVQTCVTSPPYFGLRDYGNAAQIGLEETPEAYVAKLVAVFAEVKRVLKDDGTLWLNLGDSYWGGKGSNANLDTGLDTRRAEGRTLQRANTRIEGMKVIPTNGKHETIKAKDLIGIPWMVAFALRADGWYLRSDIIWHKPNPMPESVKDRPTKAHEYIFLLSKSAKYYYDADAVLEPCADSTPARMLRGVGDSHKNVNGAPGQTPHSMSQPRENVRKQDAVGKNTYTGFNDRYEPRTTRNKRDVWTVTTKPYKGAHFATFPPDLIEPCILAGSAVGDIVLDPFNGSGTTGAVSVKHGRNYIGCELNPNYIQLTHERLAKVQPLL